MGISNFGIYKSFSTNEFLDIKNNKKCIRKSQKTFNKTINKIKSKNDLLKLKIENILIGDLIYDSFLKQYNTETIDIYSKIFKNFLKISINYFYFWLEQFKLKKIKSVISSQSVYLSSLPIRIGISKNVFV